jgi:hypothetical protein
MNPKSLRKSSMKYTQPKLLPLCSWSIAAWVLPSTFIIVRSRLLTTTTTLREKGPFDIFTNLYESKIPEEIKDEICVAEAKTAAAQERDKCVTLSMR